MIIERTKVVGMLALALLAAETAAGQDFAERMAQYQRPAISGRRIPPGATVRPAMVEETVEAPSAAAPLQRGAAPPSSQRVMSGPQSAPVHASGHSAIPMQEFSDAPTPGCATCGNYPGYFAHGGGYGYEPYGYGVGGFGCGSCFGLFGAEANCKSCGGCGYGVCDDGLARGSLVWAKFELLLWWRQGRDFPPLVTTDPTTEAATTAGVLPDAQILFGGGRDGSSVQAGARMDVGVWCDTTQCFGIGNRLWGLGKDSSEFHATSNNVPVLAIPFQDFTLNNVNDASLIAYPGLRSGEVHVGATSSVVGNDLYAKFLLCRDCDCRLDFITGWNYARFTDQIQINTRSVVTEVGGAIPNGTVRTTFDQYEARNDFNGGILGLQWQKHCGCWTAQILARVSLGNMRETMNINGSTRTTVPNQATVTTAGGVLTAPSNIGSFLRNEFTAISEAGINLGYRFAPCTQLTLGYNFIYFHDIVSPGSAINTSQGTSGGVTQPQFTFTHSDFWAQGLSLGLMQEF